jgi:hypothetical protein
MNEVRAHAQCAERSQLGPRELNRMSAGLFCECGITGSKGRDAWCGPEFTAMWKGDSPSERPFKGDFGVGKHPFVARRSLLACLFAQQAHLSLGLGHSSGASLEGHSCQKQHHSFQVQCNRGQEPLYGEAHDSDVATAPQAMPDLRFAELALDLVAFL